MALQAARASALGASLGDILEIVRKMIPVTRMVQIADTLRYLYRGGRIGRARHLVGSLLKIKPLIGVENGVVVALGLARSRMAAYRRMAWLVRKAVGPGGRIRLALTHAASRPDTEKLCRLVEELVVPAEVLLCELCPALTVHTGPSTVGLCYVPESIWDRPGTRLDGTSRASTDMAQGRGDGELLRRARQPSMARRANGS